MIIKISKIFSIETCPVTVCYSFKLIFIKNSTNECNIHFDFKTLSSQIGHTAHCSSESIQSCNTQRENYMFRDYITLLIGFCSAHRKFLASNVNNDSQTRSDLL